jgi:hypothetical protein
MVLGLSITVLGGTSVFTWCRAMAIGLLQAQLGLGAFMMVGGERRIFTQACACVWCVLREAGH